MACGRPVIASQAGGAAELFTDGVDALAHQPGDAAGLAEQIEKLMRDKSLRLAVGAAGRATAESRFHNQRLAAELLDVYQQCVARPEKGTRLAPSLPAVGD